MSKNAVPTVGSLFSGAGAFEKGFERAGFRVAWQCEIDRAARSVLARHWPDVDRHEDIRDVGRKNLTRVDVIIGGSPCQDFSVAGNRAGVGGERSGLFVEMVRVVDELKPTWVVWENVPGVFTGFDEVPLGETVGPDGPRRPVGDGAGRLVRRWWMGAVLGAFSGIGYVGAWRVLNSEYFGTAQRRRRVFGVFTRDPSGRFGARDCAEVLALAGSVRRNSQAGGPARAEVAPAVTPGARKSSGNYGTELLTVGPLMGNSDGAGYRVGADEAWNGLIIAFGAKGEGADVGSVSPPLRAMGHKDSRSNGGGSVAIVYGGGDTRGERRISPALSTGGRLDFDSEAFVVVGGQCHGGNVGEIGTLRSGHGDVQSGVPFVVCATGDRTHALTSNPFDASEDGTGRGTPIVLAFQERGSEGGPSLEYQSDLAYSLTAPNGGGRSQEWNILADQLVRRLTPLECERLQGWPDQWTRFAADGKELADGPRYRLIGNGVVEPVAHWIAKRILDVHTRGKRRGRKS